MSTEQEQEFSLWLFLRSVMQKGADIGAKEIGGMLSHDDFHAHLDAEAAHFEKRLAPRLAASGGTKAGAQVQPSFVDALKSAQDLLEQPGGYRKTVAQILDGTPWANDLPVRIAKLLAAAPAPAQPVAGEPKETPEPTEEQREAWDDAIWGKDDG